MFRRMTSAKLMWIGVAIACALGAGALQFAWATNGSGAGSTTVAGPVLLEEMDVKGQTNTEEVELSVHIARNESATEDMELDAFIRIPLGAPVRVDEPAP
jgi:hypothetical protein